MSENVSAELLNVLNEIVENEVKIAKIDAAIFQKNSKRLINEKVAFLFNMVKAEAKNYGQSDDFYFDDINLIVSHYNQKLNMVYDEYYCQYTNILNELQEARNNRRIAMINYQKSVNKSENNNSFEDNSIKEELREKNNIYKEIIDKCNKKFEENEIEFEKMLNEEFVITSKSLQIFCEKNFFQRIFFKISNLFGGEKKYTEVLAQYNKRINGIDSYEIIEKMRNNTINFVADILKIRGIDESDLQENARLGGLNGKRKTL